MASSTELTSDRNKEMRSSAVLASDTTKVIASSTVLANYTKKEMAPSTLLTSEDNIYLGQVVGIPMAKCLKNLVQTCPEDPFEWIAHWLYKWHDNNMYFAERTVLIENMVSVKQVIAEEKKLRRKNMTTLRQNIVSNKETLKADRRANFNDGTPSHSNFSFPQSTVTAAFTTSIKSEHLGVLGEHPSGRGSPKRLQKKQTLITLGSEGELISKSPGGDTYFQDLNGYKYKRDKNGRLSIFTAGGGEYTMSESGTLIQLSTSRYSVLDEMCPNVDEINKMKTMLMKQEESSRINLQDSGSNSKHHPGMATWGVNNRLALVCRHPVLGDMEPRPPLMYPETPEWWDRKGYLPETLYDHEVYSRANDDVIRNWEGMEHMTYKDFVEEGPWLFQGLLKNTHSSYAKLVQMPVGFKKRIRKDQEGDHFPEGSGVVHATATKENETTSKGSGKISNKHDLRSKGKTNNPSK